MHLCLIPSYHFSLTRELFIESRDPNCEVVELEDGSGALLALRDLDAGDWLTVAHSDDESED
jgi:hypothetical protein